jgi:UDP-N-acetylglucosamine 4,6-dehydratase/UDP-glucose 4-epimerase
MLVFEGKKILITGGTGSLGNALTSRLLNDGVDTIRIFSRNENKQITMESKFNDDRLRFLLGDVRDYARLVRAMEDIDIVFHAAALKHVPVIEYNPFEAIKTNVIGSQNVIDACLEENVEKAVAIGTDKAVSPLNTYGATKLLMEKLFVTASNYLKKERHRTKFFALRYGNVLGSSGSVIPKFIQQIKNKEKITITDPNMTRFSISMDKALDFILHATEIAKGSEIFIPKLRAYTIKDVKDALFEALQKTDEENIGIREGEKLNEILINSDEIRYTWEYENMYMILNPSVQKHVSLDEFPNKNRVADMNDYSSGNVEKISKDEMKKIIIDSGLLE